MRPRHTRSYQTLLNLVLFTKMVSQRNLTIIVGSHMALRRHPSEICILRLLAACLLVGQASLSLVRPTESLKKMSWHFNHSFCSTRTFDFDLAVGHGTEVAPMTPSTSMRRLSYRVANGNQVDHQRMFNNHEPSQGDTESLHSRIEYTAAPSTSYR